jgi:hypothetical protein
MIEIRNIILTTATILAGLSGFSLAITNLNYFSIVFLIFFVLVGIVAYTIFHGIKRERNKKVLEILNEFHDGFTTISFMKGFLDIIPLVFENLEKEQIAVLNDYYTMVQGGIAFQIRSKIEKSVKGGGIAFQIRRVITESVKEAAAYGPIETELYNILIKNASKIYEVQKKSENKYKEELLEKLFLFHDEKYNFRRLKEIFDKYKNVLDNEKLIIGACVQNQDKKELGKIVKVDNDNDKSYYITIEGHGHGIHKSFRVDNPTNGFKNSSERKEEHWLKSLLLCRHHYKIRLEPRKLKDWEYRHEVITEIDYSKRIDGKGK